MWYSGLAAGSGFHTGFVCFVVFILRQRAGRWLSCGSRTGGLSKDTVEKFASSKLRSELTCAPKGDMPAAGRLDESGEGFIKQTSQRPDMRP